MNQSIAARSSAREVAMTAGQIETMVKKLQEQLESVFCVITLRAPAMATGLDAILLTVRTLQNKGHVAALGSQAQVAQKLSQTIQCSLESLLRSNDGDLEAMLALSQAVDSLSPVVSGINKLSNVLRLTGINARIAAAHRGQEGSAFAALTQQMTELTNKAAREASDFGDRASSIRTGVSQIVEQHHAMKESLNKFRTRCESVVQQLSQSLTCCVNDIELGLGEVESSAREALGCVGQVMTTAQREDILRQGLDHVALVIQQVRSDCLSFGLSSANRSFLHQSATLCSGLIRHQRQELTELVELIARPLEALTTLSVRLIEQEQRIRDRLTIAVQDGKALAEDNRRAAGVASRTLEAFENTVIRQQGTVRSLDSSVNELGGDSTTLRMLAVPIRMEVSRTSALSGAKALSSDISAAQIEFSGLVDDASKGHRLVARRLHGLQSSIRDTESRHKVAAAESDSFASLCGDLEATTGPILHSLGELQRKATTLQAAADSFLTAVKGLRAFSEIAQDIENACERLLRFADNESSTATVLEGSWDPRLQCLIDRFTVLAHKQLAASITNDCADEGDAGGVLTLF